MDDEVQLNATASRHDLEERRIRIRATVFNRSTTFTRQPVPLCSKRWDRS